jgi:hypothetical protein
MRNKKKSLSEKRQTSKGFIFRTGFGCLKTLLFRQYHASQMKNWKVVVTIYEKLKRRISLTEKYQILKGFIFRLS